MEWIPSAVPTAAVEVRFGKEVLRVTSTDDARSFQKLVGLIRDRFQKVSTQLAVSFAKLVHRLH